MTSDTQKARELLDAAYTFLDGKIASDSRYREAFKAGCCAPFEADRLTEFAAHVTAQKDTLLKKSESERIALLASNIEMDAELFSLRAQAEKDKAEIERLKDDNEECSWFDTHSTKEHMAEIGVELVKINDPEYPRIDQRKWVNHRAEAAEHRIVKLEEALKRLQVCVDAPDL